MQRWNVLAGWIYSGINDRPINLSYAHDSPLPSAFFILRRLGSPNTMPLGFFMPPSTEVMIPFGPIEKDWLARTADSISPARYHAATKSGLLAR